MYRFTDLQFALRSKNIPYHLSCVRYCLLFLKVFVFCRIRVNASYSGQS